MVYQKYALGTKDGKGLVLCFPYQGTVIVFAEASQNAWYSSVNFRICEELRHRNTEHLVWSESSEENFTNRAIISVSSAWGLANGFSLVHFVTFPFYAHLTPDSESVMSF